MAAGRYLTTQELAGLAAQVIQQVHETSPAKHLTTEEFADRLGCDPETVRSMRRHDKGPAYIRIGRGIRYRLADIEEWERSRLVTPAAAPA